MMAGRGAAGVATGLVGAAAFATSGPMVKPLLAIGWTPGGAVLVRLTMGALLLAVPAVLAVRGRIGVIAAHWRLVVAFGLFGVAASSTLFYLAVDRLTVAVTLLVEYTGPLLLIGWAWLRTGRAPAPRTLAGAALAMGGLVLVLDVAGAVHLDTLGLAFASLAALGNAAYFAFMGVPSALPPVALAGSAMAVAALAVGALALIGVLPVHLVAAPVTMAGGQVSWWVPVLVVGVVPTAFAYGISSVSVRLLGDQVASFVALAEVLFAVLFAWAVLGEAPAAAQGLGAVLVVAGVALVRRASAVPAGQPVPVDEPAIAAEPVPA
ncbi:MAG: DMT family transporter [Actinobacteria bacterium]|nr:DMT family transporter [Actinomycetota bacterium]MCG2799817.1 DMT family transporter [Cellulomonas sp.]